MLLLWAAQGSCRGQFTTTYIQKLLSLLFGVVRGYLFLLLAGIYFLASTISPAEDASAGGYSQGAFPGGLLLVPRAEPWPCRYYH